MTLHPLRHAHVAVGDPTSLFELAAILRQWKIASSASGLAVRAFTEFGLALTEQTALPDMVVANFAPAYVPLGGLAPAQWRPDFACETAHLLRSAASRSEIAVVIVQPAQYSRLAQELERHKGRTTPAFRRGLAREACEALVRHDALLAHALKDDDSGRGKDWPQNLARNFVRRKDLADGAALYLDATLPAENKASLAAAIQLKGAAPRFEDYRSADAGLRSIAAYPTAACCIMRGEEPVAIAQGDKLIDALGAAGAAYSPGQGGILVCNRRLDLESALYCTALGLAMIVAPDIAREALALWDEAKGAVLLLTQAQPDYAEDAEFIPIDGGLLARRRT